MRMGVFDELVILGAIVAPSPSVRSSVPTREKNRHLPVDPRVCGSRRNAYSRRPGGRNDEVQVDDNRSAGVSRAGADHHGDAWLWGGVYVGSRSGGEG